MVSGITSSAAVVPDVTAMLQKMFKKLDKNSDGQVTQDELKAALAQSDSSVSDSTVSDLFSKLDTDGSGSISASEFETAAQQMRPPAPPPPPPDGQAGPGGPGGPSVSEMAQGLFSIADTDGDGKITKDQLYSALSQNGPTPDNMDQIWKETDTNSDGYVTLTEMEAAMQKKQAEMQANFSQLASGYDKTGDATEQALRSLFSVLA